jgi:ParB-like chromosome segregation protein Spo0J
MLQPLVINQDNELICGRRRFEALKMLEWTEAPINRIKTKDDIDKLLKTLAENIMRKNMSWQEEVRQKAEVDQLMREKYGSAKLNVEKGKKDFQRSSESEQHWNIEKTAELLNQSKGLISEDLQLARDLEEDPELEKIKRKSFAKRTVKQKKKRYEIDKIPKQEFKGKYNVLLADPPWDYDTKATALRGWALGNSSKADNKVLDLFAGSGSTVISAEMIRRNCFSIVLDLKFCER